MHFPTLLTHAAALTVARARVNSQTLVSRQAAGSNLASQSDGSKPPQAPPVFAMTAESIAKNAEQLISRSKNVRDKVAAAVGRENATFANVLLPLEYDDNETNNQISVLSYIESVSPDKALRDASHASSQKISDASTELGMREDIFHLVQAVRAKNETMDGESQRLLDQTYQNFLRNGLKLDQTGRDHYKKIEERLTELALEFSRTLSEENGGIWFTTEELKGLPADVLDGLEKGSGENAGKVRLTYKYPDIFPALNNVVNGDTRETIFIGNENRALANVPVLKEMVILRDEAARLLGYKNHAEYKLETKMMKTPENVDHFLGDLRQKLTPLGKVEINKLLELKQKDLKSRHEGGNSTLVARSGPANDTLFYLWDRRFYDNMMVREQYSVDQQKISEYFPLDPTIEGMMGIFAEIFGMKFHELSADERDCLSPTGKGGDLVWHEDVKVFSVWNDGDQGTGFLGYLYLDLHPRDGKYGHAANFNLWDGYTDKDGNRHYPATALVCNFPKSTATKPSLLPHDDVVTLFHELGHGIHNLVSITTYARFHGTHVARDFVEAPSQMLENWCWTPAVLKRISHHYSYISNQFRDLYSSSADGKSTPPEKTLPDELINNLIRTKHVNSATGNLRQLHFAIFDMKVHEPESPQAIKDLDLGVAWNTLGKEVTMLAGPETQGQGYKWGNGQAAFGHIGNDYDAGYYGYLSSQVYSTDMFYSAFKADPLNQAKGRSYRHHILEKGASQDEMKSLTEFLGRPPNMDAFYTDLGIPSDSQLPKTGYGTRYHDVNSQ